MITDGTIADLGDASLAADAARTLGSLGDIVVDASVPGRISVVGGNVDDAVTLKHVPIAPDGRLATPDGQIIDPRYRWMVVLRLPPSRSVPSQPAPLAGGGWGRG